MARYVIIVDGIVENVVEWDGNSDVAEGGWVPPAGAWLIQNATAQIGWRKTEASFQPPAQVPAPVPDTVSPRQLKLALLAAGLLDQIDAFVGNAATPREAKISWEYATEYRRDNALLNAMAAQLNPPMPAEQIDQLFIAAATIP